MLLMCSKGGLPVCRGPSLSKFAAQASSQSRVLPGRAASSSPLSKKSMYRGTYAARELQARNSLSRYVEEGEDFEDQEKKTKRKTRAMLMMMMMVKQKKLTKRTHNQKKKKKHAATQRADWSLRYPRALSRGERRGCPAA